MYGVENEQWSRQSFPATLHPGERPHDVLLCGVHCGGSSIWRIAPRTCMTTLAGMRRVTSASSLDDDDDDESSVAASPSAGSASPSFRDLKVAAASWKMVSSPCCARTETSFLLRRVALRRKSPFHLQSLGA